MIEDELTKKGYRARAIELLKKCKEREQMEDVVAVRKNAQTVVLMPRSKALKNGLIKK